jgi:hypothetical protein
MPATPEHVRWKEHRPQGQVHVSLLRAEGAGLSFYRQQVTRTDAAAPEIIEALREAGYWVWVIGRPADALIWHPTFGQGVFKVLEIKTPTSTGKPRKRKDQPKQDAFVAATGVQRVWTVPMAFMALQAAR